MRRLLFALSVVAVLWSAACNGGGSTIQPPPPTGKYSVSSLNGTYAFTTSGEVCAGCNFVTVPAAPLARVGSFIADGKGGITGGIYDVVTQGGASSTVSINSNSSYTVNADGRGTLTFNVASGGAPTSINFGIVLTSTADGLIIDETTTSAQASTGSGNFILQSTAAFQLSTVSGSYVFDFTGFDGNVSSAGGPFPESLVGQFTVNNGGQITTGFEDANDGFALANGSMAPGTLTADPVNMSTSGRGTAVIEGQDYAFYIIDSTRVRLVSSNANTGNVGPMLSGDAVLQSNTIPTSLSAISGGFAFLVGGSDFNSNGLTRVGRFTASGSALSKMLMDVNDGSNETQFDHLSNGSISSYDAATGRGQFSFQDSNGQVYAFVFYLSSQSGGVLQDISPSGTQGQARVVADGSINLQSGSPFTSNNISGTYAMNWSGLVTANGSTDEEDVLGQVKISSLSLTGTSDIFQFTSNPLTPNLDIGTAGSINFNGGDGTGGDANHTRVDMNVNLSNITPIHMVVYIVNPQLAFFANRDNSDKPRNVAGILKIQQ
jgi:hypothetical protein